MGRSNKTQNHTVTPNRQRSATLIQLTTSPRNNQEIDKINTRHL